MNWQLIETAPKDGTVILTWTDGLGIEGGAYMPVQWDKEEGWTEFWGNHGLRPTHWMNMPNPPGGF